MEQDHYEIIDTKIEEDLLKIFENDEDSECKVQNAKSLLEAEYFTSTMGSNIVCILKVYS